MKTTTEIITEVIKDINKDNSYLNKVWCNEEEIIEALDILPCEELKDECLERLGIIRGLEE